MSEPNEYVKALANERAGYLRTARGDRVIAVDEQLRLSGWAVDVKGSLVPFSESDEPKRRAKRAPREDAAAEKAPERAVED